MINLCIVGSGDVVKDRHAAILKDLSKNVRVRCIVTRRQPAFSEVQKQLGYPVKRVTTIDAALKLGITAALVAVTPSSTVDVATYLVRLNIPLYVEKPLGNDPIAAAKFIEEVSRRSTPVVVGENFQRQERFSIAKSMYTTCRHDMTHIVIRDTLRRGLRTNPRTDDELFAEHLVHIISSIRALTGKTIKTIIKASKRTVGSLTEYSIECLLEDETQIEIQLTLTNTWSEDRYSLVFKDADIKIGHRYDYSTKMYIDTVEHWHGSEKLVEVRTLDAAACGMRKCWDEFLQLLKVGSKKKSLSLMRALNDIQVREAIQIALSCSTAVPVIKFDT